MKIRNVVHRGLRRFIQRNEPSGLAAAVVERVRNILTFLQEMEEGTPRHAEVESASTD
jgi:proteic killer suppression protein